MPRYEDNAVGNYQRAGDRLNNVEQHVDSIADQIALAQADLLRSAVGYLHTLVENTGRIAAALEARNDADTKASARR
ncbi:hypothetical protein [Catenuloplanes japonicus]|uniref:hypothetical protein n=1 Tax=Catenuloplanes japonicus TaxID=33876 RepID=UPI00052454F0|nr:hypothetical protein [Catenuloplanes japonicus]